ncbi:MAG: hypothetical protein AAGL17_25485 [Cyanobacteria bacterium J06576_12]
MAEITVENVRFRIVGAYLRVNEPFNEATVPDPGFQIPPFFDIPALTFNYDGAAPTIEDYMKGLQTRLQTDDFVFDFDGLDDPMKPPRRILQNVRFGKKGDTLFELNAGILKPETAKTPALGTAWQYYLFDLSGGGDVRQEVVGRAGFNQTVVKSNMRIIWRLISTYLNKDSSQLQLLSRLKY